VKELIDRLVAEAESVYAPPPPRPGLNGTPLQGRRPETAGSAVRVGQAPRVRGNSPATPAVATAHDRPATGTPPCTMC